MCFSTTHINWTKKGDYKDSCPLGRSVVYLSVKERKQVRKSTKPNKDANLNKVPNPSKVPNFDKTANPSKITNSDRPLPITNYLPSRLTTYLSGHPHNQLNR